MDPARLLARHASELVRNLRLALRRIRRERTLPAAIVLTLGLGLGAAAAVFTAFEATLLQPPPYTEPDRLVHVWEVRAATGERGPTSYATLLDWRARSRAFAGLEGYDPMNPTVGIGDHARMLRGGEVTPGFFRLLGVPMAAGRDFGDEGDPSDEAAVAVVSARFAREANAALGRTLTVNGAPHVIIGVLPDTFHFAPLQNADVWVPFAMVDDDLADRSQRRLNVLGRLQGTARIDAAAAELGAVMRDLAREAPDAMAGRTALVLPLHHALLGNVRPIVVALAIAVALLVLTMATNVALLMLTRYVERAPELALRSALGATRARVLRQLFAESLLLAVAGGALAAVLGHIATRRLLGAIPDGVLIGMPYLADVGLDGSVLAFIAGLSVLLAVAFGVGPGLVATAGQGRMADARSTRGSSERRLRQRLVVAQLALTVVLLISAGLLAGSFRNLVGRDVGFADPEGVVAAGVSLSGARYQEPAAQGRFYDELLGRVAGLPGVRSVGAISDEPGGGGGGWITPLAILDRPLPPSAQPRVALRIVAGEYFSTMGIPLLVGRPFERGDREDTRPVAVVSAELARLLSADGPVLGRRIRLTRSGGVEWEVVGVVGDVQVAALDAESAPVAYVPHRQLPENRMSLVFRSGLGPAPLARAVRTVVAGMDPGVPVFAVGTLQEKMRESRAVFTRRFPMLLVGAFAVAALALALVALYAMVAHEVLTRRREFAIRVALGASAREVRRLVLRQGAVLGLIGVGAGAVLALAVSRSLAGLLYGIAATDWRVYAAAAAAVLALALGATLQPALRAAKVELSTTLREG